jgi:hypothetical protein
MCEITRSIDRLQHRSVLDLCCNWCALVEKALVTGLLLSMKLHLCTHKTNHVQNRMHEEEIRIDTSSGQITHMQL